VVILIQTYQCKITVPMSNLYGKQLIIKLLIHLFFYFFKN
jgi:hypothetical protein